MGIKTIKAYCWEQLFERKVKAERDMQLKYIYYTHILYSVVYVIVLNGGFLITIVLFGYHWLRGKEINYSSALVVYTLATYISYRNMANFYHGLNMTIKLYAICKRASEVLQMDEYDNKNNELGEEDNIDLRIYCNNVSATWGYKILKDVYSGETEIVDQGTKNLEDIDLEVGISDLVAVIGPVGSGKSTLLALIMNELTILKGEVKTRGKICYVEQDPFILSETVEENILFGLPYDKFKFRKTIKVC